jgi:hypothetical protein
MSNTKYIEHENQKRKRVNEQYVRVRGKEMMIDAFRQKHSVTPADSN